MNELAWLKELFTKRGIRIAEESFVLDIRFRTRKFAYYSFLMLSIFIPLNLGMSSSVGDSFWTVNNSFSYWVVGLLSYVLCIASQKYISRAKIAYVIGIMPFLPFSAFVLIAGIRSLKELTAPFNLVIIAIALIFALLYLSLGIKRLLPLFRESIISGRLRSNLNRRSGVWDSRNDKIVSSKWNPGCVSFLLLVIGIPISLSLVLRFTDMVDGIHILRSLFAGLGYVLMLFNLQVGLVKYFILNEWEKKLEKSISLV